MIERGEFKGNKMLIIKRTEDDKYPFMFGKNKARRLHYTLSMKLQPLFQM